MLPPFPPVLNRCCCRPIQKDMSWLRSKRRQVSMKRVGMRLSRARLFEALFHLHDRLTPYNSVDCLSVSHTGLDRLTTYPSRPSHIQIQARVVQQNRRCHSPFNLLICLLVISFDNWKKKVFPHDGLVVFTCVSSRPVVAERQMISVGSI